MEATTEPVFPVLNRWLPSLRCTMFHSLLHHKSYLKTWTLSPWARDLRFPERQFCPPRALPSQLLLSSDMDPVDHPSWQWCVPERKAKWMASKWTERMPMHRMHSDVRAKHAPNCQTTEDLKSCYIRLNPLHRDPHKASATFGNPQVLCAPALLHVIKRGPGRAGRRRVAKVARLPPTWLQSHEVEFNSAVTLSS